MTSTLRSLAQALIAFTRLCRALAYYPPEHPALGKALTDVEEAFHRCLTEGGALTLEVSRRGFRHGGRPVAAESPPVLELARLLTNRRITGVELRDDLDGASLLQLARLLNLGVDDIYHRGGLTELLLQAGVESIRLRETRLSEAERARETTGATAPPPPPPPPVSPPPPTDFRALLARLRAADPDEFNRLLPEVERVAGEPLRQAPVRAALALLPLLLHHSRRRDLTPEQRQPATDSLERLATPAQLEALVDAVGDRRLDPRRQKALAALLLHFFDRALEPLLRRWEMADAALRERLLRLIGLRRRLALERLRSQLTDDDPPLAAITLIGLLRDETAVPQLQTLIRHPDATVRRESLRALARIGGGEAGATLLQQLMAVDRENRLLAITCLGQMGLEEAIPVLIRLVRGWDPLGRRDEEKRAAIAALGRLGGDAALKLLLRLLRPRWRGGARSPLRAAAITAISCWRHPAVDRALQRARTDRHRAVRLAATQALQSRNERHGRTPA